MLGLEVTVSLKNFLGTFITFFIVSMLLLYYDLNYLTLNVIIFTILATNTYFHLRSTYKNYAFRIAIRAAFLGCILALGIYIKLVAPLNVRIFGTYMAVMAIFHYTEFLAIAIVQPSQVTTDSYMINHSPQYTIAAISSWLEFFIEAYYFPNLKQIEWLSNIGLFMCIFGELLRKIAIFTAGSNFNHLVQCEKAKNHVLVTHGVYRLCRHPSYVGWFYWSIGTQIILINPICIVAYAIASWMFFKSRIFIEEITLLSFFGQQYCNYQKRVGTGIPFIKGYDI